MFKGIDKKLLFCIVLGWALYLSRYARTGFKEQGTVLFWLGFIPNFGLSFALPLIYVSNRIKSNQPIKHFNLACLITLLIMIFNELVDKIQPSRVFDWFDIYASFVGVVCAYLFYRFIFNPKA